MLLLLLESLSMSHRRGCATYTQVYSLGFIIHLPIRQPSETMTPQTPIYRAWLAADDGAQAVAGCHLQAPSLFMGC